MPFTILQLQHLSNNGIDKVEREAECHTGKASILPALTSIPSSICFYISSACSTIPTLQFSIIKKSLVSTKNENVLAIQNEAGYFEEAERPFIDRQASKEPKLCYHLEDLQMG